MSTRAYVSVGLLVVALVSQAVHYDELGQGDISLTILLATACLVLGLAPKDRTP